nr:hypothetical protein [Lachnospiraceae bacterium]
MKRSFEIVSRIVFVLVFGALLSLFTSVEAAAAPLISVHDNMGGVQSWTQSPQNPGHEDVGNNMIITIVLKNGYELDGDIRICDNLSNGTYRDLSVDEFYNRGGIVEVQLSENPDHHRPEASITIFTKKIQYNVIVNSGGHGTASAVSGLVNGK